MGPKVAIVSEFYPSRRDPVLGVWAHRQALAARDAGADVRVVVLHRLVPPREALAAGPVVAARALIARLREPRRQQRDGVEVLYVPYLSPPRAPTYASWGAWAAPALRLALRKLGAGAVVIPADADPTALRRLPAAARSSVVLACEHGVAAWQAARLPGVIVGDDVGVLWWRALEAHESPEPFDLSPPAAGDVIARLEANGRWSLLINGPEDEVGLVAIAGA